jgi:hypothetical protein
MARRRRNSNGQFKKGRSTKRKRRKKGMGSIITVRRSKGMGQLDATTLMPVALGGGLSALTAIALRYFVDPSAGTTQSMLVKWAPAFGLATGSLASLALFMMGGNAGMEQATRAFLSALVVSGAGLGSDMVLREKPAIAATIISAPALAGYGMGAIVPEYSRQPGGMGAIVMEPVGPSGQRAGTIGGIYGETVNLAGVNTSAFGTPGFNA